MAGKARKRRSNKNPTEVPISRPKRETEKSSGSCCKTLFLASVAITASVSALLIYGYATSPISSVIVDDVPSHWPSVWEKFSNSNLQNGRRLLTELTGPESIAVDSEQSWYTGLADGRLLKIENGGEETERVNDLSKIVKYTAGGERTAKRPLGMRIFQDKLYFADSYQGIFSINLKTLKWEKIVGYDEVQPHINFANDLTISSDGEVYFTDASSRWQYSHTLNSVVEGECSGRIFKKGHKGLHLIRAQLCFPNGIELSFDESKLLVSENSRQRVLVINLSTGSLDKKIYLPGGGDNIRRSAKGGYWVPVPVVSDQAQQYLKKLPFLRDIALSLLGNKLQDMALKAQGTVVKLNDQFEIEEIHQDAEGKISRTVTEMREYQPGKFLLGSFLVNGIVKIDGLPS